MGVQIYISAYVATNAKILEVKRMKSVLDYESSLKRAGQFRSGLRSFRII